MNPRILLALGLLASASESDVVSTLEARKTELEQLLRLTGTKIGSEEGLTPTQAVLTMSCACGSRRPGADCCKLPKVWSRPSGLLTRVLSGWYARPTIARVTALSGKRLKPTATQVSSG